jgi:hypothetical protein
MVIAVLVMLGSGIALVFFGTRRRTPPAVPSSADARKMGRTESVRSDGNTKMTVRKTDPWGNPVLAGVGDTNTSTNRFCNMSLSNKSLNGMVDWWVHDNTENFSLAPMSVITEANSGQNVLNISYYDDESGNRVKGVYSALQTVGLPSSGQCSIDQPEYCQFTASSSDPPQTYVYSSDPNGNNGSWKSAEGLLDCISASAIIKQCEDPYIPNNTPDCGCTEMSQCWASPVVWACALSCILSNLYDSGESG